MIVCSVLLLRVRLLLKYLPDCHVLVSCYTLTLCVTAAMFLSSQFYPFSSTCKCATLSLTEIWNESWVFAYGCGSVISSLWGCTVKRKKTMCECESVLGGKDTNANRTFYKCCIHDQALITNTNRYASTEMQGAAPVRNVLKASCHTQRPSPSLPPFLSFCLTFTQSAPPSPMLLPLWVT